MHVVLSGLGVRTLRSGLRVTGTASGSSPVSLLGSVSLKIHLLFFFYDGPELRRCDGRGEEHLLLQFCRALDDGSGFFGVSLLDEEVLD